MVILSNWIQLYLAFFYDRGRKRRMGSRKCFPFMIYSLRRKDELPYEVNFLKLKEHNCVEKKKIIGLPRGKHSVTEQVCAFQHIQQ